VPKQINDNMLMSKTHMNTAPASFAKGRRSRFGACYHFKWH